MNISKNENLNRLLDTFHQDRQKGLRFIPSLNLSLALHQLTKPTCEHLRKASLTHLIFQTVFLQALGLGKQRSEIHAWLNKNIRHQEDWSKVTFYCVNTSYLVDRCICPAPCRSCQTLEKNVLSWALAGIGSVLFIRQGAV